MDNPVVQAALVTGFFLTISALLVRWTGRETNQTGHTVGEMQAITTRLQTELQTLDAGQKMWQAMFDSASERIDQQAAELATLRADLAAARAEHAACRADLARVQAEVRQLQAEVRQLRAPHA